MKKVLTIALFMIAVAAVFPSRSFAIGIGVYGLGGGGEAEVDIEGTSPFRSGGNSFDVDTSHGGVGFMLDTAVAKDKLFNYRLSIGFEGLDLEDDSGYSPDIGSFVIDQDFGLGFVRGRKARVWAGPELRLSWSRGEFEHTPYDIRLFGVGLGPAIGVNIHLSRRVSLALKGGFLHIEYSGKIEDDSPGGRKRDIDVSEDMAFISLGILFRSGDAPPSTDRRPERISASR